MPSWVLFVFTMIMVLAWVAATWTLVQAIINHMAVKGSPDLRAVTHRAVMRLAGLETAITLLVVVSFLSLPIPRPPLFRTLSTLGLLAMALAVAGLCFREFWDMRRQLDESL